MFGSALRWTHGHAYPDMGAQEGKLASVGSNFNAYGNNEVASLGKSRFNALWAVRGERTVIRVRSSRDADYGGCVDWYFQRFNVDKTWDAFHAMRDTRMWTSAEDQQWSYAPRYRTSANGQIIEDFRAEHENNVCRTSGNPPFYVRLPEAWESEEGIVFRGKEPKLCCVGEKE